MGGECWWVEGGERGEGWRAVGKSFCMKSGKKRSILRQVSAHSCSAAESYCVCVLV